MISRLGTIFVVLIWNPFKWANLCLGCQPTTLRHYSSQDATMLSTTGIALLFCVVYSCCCGPAEKVPFCHNTLIFTQTSPFETKGTAQELRQSSVYIGPALSYHQEIPVARNFPFLTQVFPEVTNDIYQPAARIPSMGSDPIYSPSTSNNVKTTWHYNKDFLHMEGNILGHNASSVWSYIYEQSICVSTQQSTFEISKFQVDFVNFLPGN